MILRGLFAFVFVALCVGICAQNAHQISFEKTYSTSQKKACVDQYAGTISMGSVQAQSDRIDLGDTTFLCYQDMFNVIHDGNGNLTGDPDISTAPGLGYVWYDCPPSIFGPDLDAIRMDPCLISSPPAPNGFWAFIDQANGDAKFQNGNNVLGGMLTTVPDFFNGGDPFQVWFAPITFDDASTLGYENGGPCVNSNINEAFSVVYLNPIEVINKNITDLSGNPFVAEFEVRGGLSEFDGSSYPIIEVIKTNNTTIRGTLTGGPYRHGDIVTFTVPEEGEYIITIEDGVSCGVSNPFLISQNNENIVFTIGDTNGQSGETVCVPFSVENFDSIEVFQFTINFDPNVLEYSSIVGINLIGLDTSTFNLLNVDNGEIRLIWIDPNLFEGDGVSVPDGQEVWQICFELRGQPGTCSNVTITGAPLEIEVQNSSGQLLDTSIDPGEICIAAPDVLSIFTSSCAAPAGSMAGSLQFSIYGGTPPYNYFGDIPAGSIPNSGGSASVTGLDPGDYMINILDAMGNNTSATITITDGPGLSIDSIFVRNPRCFGYADGRIEIEEVSGGTEPYSYNWSNFLFNVTELRDLPQGAYSVTVTDNNGCTATAMELLQTEPIIPTVTVLQSATCEGVLDAIIRVRAEGGTPIGGALYQYNIQWEDEDGNTQVSATTGPQRTLGNVGGTVQIEITDANTCMVETDFEVPVRKTLGIDALSQDILCFGEGNGQINISVTTIGDPATLPIQYDILDSTGMIVESNASLSNSYDFLNLEPNNYTINIIDGEGCEIDTSIQISQPSELMMDFDASGLECSGSGNDGMITLTPSGGVEPYSILWDDGDTALVRSGLSNGLYPVTLTDANMCQVPLSIDLTQGGNLLIDSVQVTRLDCPADSNATIQLFVSSNSPNVTYNWSNGESTPTISDLESGEYYVTVSNDQGCEILDTFQVVSPQPLTIDVVPGTPNCPGQNGSLSIIVDGGTGSYDYNWDHPNNTGNATLPGIPAGDYTVTVTDSNNCSIIRSIVLADPDSIEVDLDPANIQGVNCVGDTNGGASAVASGGTQMTGIYNFMWSSGATSSGANSAVNDLSQGTQWLLVNDGVCSTDTLFFDVPSPDSIKLDLALIELNEPTCFGLLNGSIVAAATGGTGALSISWPNQGVVGATLPSVGAGNYLVEIEDESGCIIQDSIELNQPNEFLVQIDSSATVNLTCFSSNTGQIRVQTVGGNTGDFQYSWSDNVSTTDIASNLGPGTYSVTVTDSGGCTNSLDFEMTSPPAITASVPNPPDPFCFGGTTCLGVESASGGVGNRYTFSINRGPRFSIDTCINVLAGPYIVTVFDSTGCSQDYNVTAEQPMPFTVDLGPDVTLPLGDSTSIDVMVEGQFPVDSVLWNPISDLECLNLDCMEVEVSPVSTTMYRVLVKDVNGCEAQDEVLVTVSQNRNVYIPNAFNPLSRNFENNILKVYSGSGVVSIDFFRIFDRWGNLMYEAENLTADRNGSEGWDGTFNGDLVNPGVYVYFTKVNFEDGQSLTYKGSVTVIH